MGRYGIQRLGWQFPLEKLMKTNPKTLAEAHKLLCELRDWTQIENGLERENFGAAQVWREVNDWAHGSAKHLGLDLNLPASQPITSPSEVGGRHSNIKNKSGCAAGN